MTCHAFDCRNILTGRQAKWCSAACYQRHRRLVTRRAPVVATCPECEVEFFPQKISHKYCSPTCRVRARGKRQWKAVKKTRKGRLKKRESTYKWRQENAEYWRRYNRQWYHRNKQRAAV